MYKSRSGPSSFPLIAIDTHFASVSLDCFSAYVNSALSSFLIFDCKKIDEKELLCVIIRAFKKKQKVLDWLNDLVLVLILKWVRTFSSSGRQRAHITKHTQFDCRVISLEGKAIRPGSQSLKILNISA